jgi:hypothetical protein
VHIVALATGRQPIAVMLNESQGFHVSANVPMMISVPPKSDPNQKGTPPSPERIARSVSATLATRRRQRVRVPVHVAIYPRALSTSASTGSPRLASSSRRPPPMAARTMSLTLASWACAICLAMSSRLRMRAAVPANRAVQACARRTVLSPQLAPGRPRRLCLAQRADRVRETRQQAMQSLDPPPHVVAEQVAGRGHRPASTAPPLGRSHRRQGRAAPR